ncbi:MAG: hypothetical protein SNJ53_02375 [Thermodesulfovibrionales bacterium]
MRYLFVFAMLVVFILSLATLSFAGWDSCKGCHTDAGKPAPSKAEFQKKFKSIEDLVKAAMASKNPMMQNFKNETLLRAAAKDIGLKDLKSDKKP